jgi:integrase
MTALAETETADIMAAAFSGIGDKGYQGSGFITPFKKPRGGELLDWQKEFNAQVSRLRAIRRDIFNHAWRCAVAGVGLQVSRETGTHQLRHRYASVLLGSGQVNIRELAEYMGHSDPAITLRTYIHLLPSAPDRARKAVEDAMAAEDKPASPARNRRRRG